MRGFFVFWILLFVSAVTHAQNTRPTITGQKELVTDQGKPITIRLTDLFVIETPVGNGDNDGEDGDNDGDDDDANDGDNGEGNNDGGDDGDNEGGDRDDDRDGDNDDGDGGDRGDNGDNDDDGDRDGDENDHRDGDRDDDDGDDKDRDDDDDDRNGDRDEKGDKGDKDNKGDKGDKDNKGDKGDKGNKGNKGNKGDKNKGPGGTTRTLYPENYVLEIFPGDGYTFSDKTVTPHANFTGVLTVSVRVKNQYHASPKYPLKITVKALQQSPKNQPPSITGQKTLITPEDTPLTIKLSDLTVIDADNTYPENFTLKLSAGENYTISNTTVAPAPGFVGNLTVPAVVNDGDDDSPSYNLTIVVAPRPRNATPEITGQVPLSISKNQSVNIVPSHLIVRDPDNTYPAGFTLKIYPGTNYTLNGTIISPAKDFTGALAVKVSVHDGFSESKVYDLAISVVPGPNVKPVITGQTGTKIPEGESIVLNLSHLVVEDHDNRYPEDFTLNVSPGKNYHLEGHTITPAAGFLGTLTAEVSVHDGMDASEPFSFKIEVFARGRLEIVGQKGIEINEDSVFSPRLDHLVVSDPTNTFPQGFSLILQDGADYDILNGKIKPHADFSGNITIPVKLSKGGNTSATFDLLVVVLPVNDAPVLLNLESDPVVVTGSRPAVLTSAAEVHDVDDDYLLFGEISFDPETYQSGIDKLEFDGHERINTVFDTESGVLFLLGQGTHEEYNALIRSVHYRHDTDSLPLTGSKKIFLKLHDGKNTSATYERILLLETNSGLEIPSAFTPNNDQANDTWEITLRQHDDQTNTVIRVYDKRGNVVYESAGLDKPWDGHFNGAPLPADVYFYTIEMDVSYKRISYKGIVSILR